jgi:transposase
MGYVHDIDLLVKGLQKKGAKKLLEKANLLEIIEELEDNNYHSLVKAIERLMNVKYVDVGKLVKKIGK